MCSVVSALGVLNAAVTFPVLEDWKISDLLPALSGGVAAGHAVTLLYGAPQRVAKDAVRAAYFVGRAA